jgi:hypothetical protein
MFSSKTIVKPLFASETQDARFLIAPTSEFQRLYLKSMYHALLERAPRSVAAYQSGEAEAMLLDVVRKDIGDPKAARRDPFGQQLRDRADQLLSAARFMKLFPDKDLSRHIARGGFAREIYQPEEVEGGESETLNLGEIIRSASARTTDAAGEKLGKSRAVVPVSKWLDSALQAIGRKSLFTAPVGQYLPGPEHDESTDPGTVAAKYALETIVQDRSGESFADAAAKYFLLLKYLEFAEKPDELLYAADFTSVAFTRFVATRFRDYANLYTAAAVIGERFAISQLVMSADAGIAYLGEERTPQSALADMKTAIQATLSGDRVRLAGQFGMQVESAYKDWVLAQGATHVMPDLPVFAMMTKDPALRYHLPLLPTYTDVKRGMPLKTHTADESQLTEARAYIMKQLRKASADAGAFAANLPMLEAASDLLAKGIGVAIVSADPAVPRLSTVTDTGPTTTGIISTTVDEHGRVVDDLLPYMSKLLNYTVELEQRTPPKASRVVAFTPPAGVGLPAEALMMPVPVNYTEGERLFPIKLGMRDLPAVKGSDFLRFLDAFLPSLQDGELPYVMAQLASAYVVLWKDDPSEAFSGRVEAQDVLDKAWYAMLPSEHEAFVYGQSIRDVVQAQVSGITREDVISHPDPTVRCALVPLNVIPKSRSTEYVVHYVFGNKHKLVPVLKALEKVPFERAHFTSMTLPAHGLGWYSVDRSRTTPPILKLAHTGRLEGYREDAVGYLDDAVLTSAVTPWKGPSASVPQDAIPVEKAVEAPIEVARGPEATV